MSLTDASKKMSKSDPSPRSKINLNDSTDEIRQKITKAKTDSILGITWDPQQRPELANLLQIFSALSGRYFTITITITITKTHNHTSCTLQLSLYRSNKFDFFGNIHSGVDSLCSNTLFIRSIEDICQEFATKDMLQFKNALIDVVISSICPIGKKMSELRKDKEYLERVLKEGSQQANEIAQQTMKEVRQLTGLV
jgi:tryptophanyl-tRNA synthetase